MPRVVVGDIPLEPPGFQPRTALLAELDRAGALVPVIHFVTGGPGVGKTTMAAAYARAKLAAGWRLVAWVNAADTLTLLAGLARTADVAGLNEGATGPDSSDPGQLVRRRLEADGDRCLLVFDDARDPDLLQTFVPAYGAARVLVTGPARSPSIQGTSVPVDVFRPDEASAFLTARTGRVDPSGAGALAAELGYEPLALAQAASVIFQQSLGYRAYLEYLRAVPVEESLSREAEQSSVPGHVQAVLLALGLAEAADRTGVCTIVIEILAVLSAAGVRRDLLHAAGQAGALAAEGHQVTAALVDEALARLADLALVTIGLDGQLVLMHRSVMLVVRAHMARRGRLTAVCRLAASLLEAWTQALAVFPNRLAVRDVPGQVSALVDNAAGPAGEDRELAGTLLRLLASAYLDVDRDIPEVASAGAVLATAEVSQDEDEPGEEVSPEEEVPKIGGDPPAVEVRPAGTAPAPAPPAPSDLEPQSPRPEPSVKHDNGRPGRVLGLAAAILIVLGAGGLTFGMTHSHAAARFSEHVTSPSAPGPVQMAAGWISQEVSRSAIVACDPETCAALEAQGVPATSLVVVRASTTSLLDAQVVVATSVVRGQFGGRLDSVYAPSTIATFGSGSGRVNVQVVASDGAAVYLAALRQDLAARQAAGAQLLDNKHITVAAQARPQLAAGEIDSRLLILLTALAAVHPLQILAFGDPGPGASPGVPWCSADLSGSGRAAGMADASYVSWLAAYVRAQLLPFAGSITTLRQDDQLVVRIEYSRPSPLGLLSRGAI